MYKLDGFTISHLLCLTVTIVPVDFGQHKGMYKTKANINFLILLSAVYM
jgi:hypothetical protein